MGLFQTAAVPLLFAQPADAAAIIIHSEPIASAASNLAANDEKFAAILDRFLQAGPYAALITAVMPLLFQLAANHKLLPPQMIEAIGLQSKGDLEAMAMSMMSKQAQNGQSVSADAEATGIKP
jgi:hypothetical protein